MRRPDPASTAVALSVSVAGVALLALALEPARWVVAGWALAAAVIVAAQTRTWRDRSLPVPEPSVRPAPSEDVLTALSNEVEFGELLGEEFLVPTLETRVATARRVLRPVSLVYFEVLDRIDDRHSPEPTDPLLVTEAIRATLRESDIACRADDGSYVMILEDTSEDGAVWTAERIRRSLHSTNPVRLFRAGVAAYPTHGLDAEELHGKSVQALVLARDWQRDRIEVAHQL